jgi:sterol-4alpha-carboxylate 3-dehydrogenase (decarboxylating)
VHAILRVVEGKIPETSATYFVKGPGEHSWYDFKHALEKAMERSLKVIRVPTFLVGAAGYLFSLGSWITRKPNIINKDKMREVQEQRWLIDSSAFEQAYSYKPEWGLEHGLRETYRWYREANWL